MSATNGDNAYGSEVVERILDAPHLQNSAAQPDMLLLPMDSAKYAELGQQKLLLVSFISTVNDTNTCSIQTSSAAAEVAGTSAAWAWRPRSLSTSSPTQCSQSPCLAVCLPRLSYSTALS